MKKKAIKIGVSLVMLLLVLWCAIFVTDYTRCGALQEPLFVVAGSTADDGGSGVYYGLGYTVVMQKHLSVEYGVVIESVQMMVLGKVVSASIT